MGLHKSIQLSFLVVGHTKFSPDWCFGLLKQKFKRSSVNCLDELVDVVNESAVVNRAQLVGSQSGEVIVPTYNWAEYLGSQFEKIHGIKSNHHFLFSSLHPGTVRVKQYCESEEITHLILKDQAWRPTAAELPPVIHPTGLSIDRQWYLFQKIREFCSVDTRDLVCPFPGPGPCPNPSLTRSPILPSRLPANDPVSPPTKKRRVCGKCGKRGHNTRTCDRQKVL